MQEFPCMLYLKYADGYIEAFPNRSAGPQKRGAFHRNWGEGTGGGALISTKDNIESSVKLSFAVMEYKSIKF